MTQSNGAMDLSRLEPRPLPIIYWVSIEKSWTGFFQAACACGWRSTQGYQHNAEDSRNSHITLHWQRGEEARK